MRVGARTTSPRLWSATNGAGAVHDSPVFSTTFRNIGARQKCIALYRADREAGEVVVVVLVHTRQFGGFASDQRASSLAAADTNARDHSCADLRFQLPAGVIVEEKKRFGALHHKVVHAHRDQINADRIVTADFDGDFELCADAV